MSITPNMALKAIYHLQEAHDEALIAHYATKDPSLQIAALNDLRRHFERAATELGFTLTPITEAPHVATPSTVDPDSGRPSLEEPAAPSELFGNFGG